MVGRERDIKKMKGARVGFELTSPSSDLELVPTLSLSVRCSKAFGCFLSVL